jgi:hypothetical protein
MLDINPTSRYSINQIKKSSWFQYPNRYLDVNGMCSDPEALAEKMKSKLEIVEEPDTEAFAYSQPNDMRFDRESAEMMDEYRPTSRIMSFSQPVHNFAEETNSPQDREMESVSLLHLITQNTQIAKRGLFSDLFPSTGITRFFSPYPAEEIFDRLATIFQEFVIPCKMQGLQKVFFVLFLIP